MIIEHSNREFKSRSTFSISQCLSFLEVSNEKSNTEGGNERSTAIEYVYLPRDRITLATTSDSTGRNSRGLGKCYSTRNEGASQRNPDR